MNVECIHFFLHLHWDRGSWAWKARGAGRSSGSRGSVYWRKSRIFIVQRHSVGRCPGAFLHLRSMGTDSHFAFWIAVGVIVRTHQVARSLLGRRESMSSVQHQSNTVPPLQGTAPLPSIRWQEERVRELGRPATGMYTRERKSGGWEVAGVGKGERSVLQADDIGSEQTA